MNKPCVPLIYTKWIEDLFPNVYQRADKLTQNSEEWQRMLYEGPLNSDLIEEAVKQEFYRNGSQWRLMKEGRALFNTELDFNNPSFFKALKETDTELLSTAASWISPAIAWRPYKQIYSFSKELTEVLKAQKDVQMNMPVEILKSMPYPCAYFDVPLNEDCCGFFVHFTLYENGKNFLALEFVLKGTNKTIGYGGYCELEMKANTTIENEIRSCYLRIRTTQPERFTNITNKWKNTDSKDDLNRSLELASTAMQFILYVCARNAEIRADGKNKPITKTKLPKIIKDVYREVHNSICGEEFAANVRKMSIQNKEDSLSKAESAGSQKAPHVRRGHWHHYWTGPHDGERKLVLNWLAPTFVHGEQDVEATTNLIDIDKAKDK